MSQLKLDRFKSNPVMLYNHGELVGRWENLRLEDGRLLGDPVYMEDDGEALSLKIKNRVEKGFVKGASIGIHVLASTSDEKNIALAVVEIFECSLCDIPSNQNAIVLYDREGIKLEGQALSLALKGMKNKELKTKNTQEMKLSEASYQVLGIDADASSEAIDRAIFTLKKGNEELQGKLDKAEEEKVKALIDKGLSEGRFLADKKESFEKLAQADYELARQTIEALPGKKTLAGKEELSLNSGDDRSQWTFADWRKKDTKGLLAIKAEHPEKYANILTR